MYNILLIENSLQDIEKRIFSFVLFLGKYFSQSKIIFMYIFLFLDIFFYW